MSKLATIKKVLDSAYDLVKSVSFPVDHESTKELSKIKVANDSKYESQARKSDGEEDEKEEQRLMKQDEKEDLEKELKALIGESDKDEETEKADDDEDDDLKELKLDMDKEEKSCKKADDEDEPKMEDLEEEEDEEEEEVSKAKKGLVKLTKSISDSETRNYITALVLSTEKYVTASQKRLKKSLIKSIKYLYKQNKDLKRALNSYAKANTVVVKSMAEDMASVPNPLKGRVQMNTLS